MRSRYFNMVEVTLALGVVGIGIVSIMALFPIGFNATRDSVAESYASDSADQLLHWFAVMAKKDWATYAPGTTELPSSKPSTGISTDQASDWAAVQQLGPTSWRTKHASENGVYKISVKRGESVSAPDEFTGVYRIWGEAVETSKWDASVPGWVTAALPTTDAFAINLEVSWPLQLPYERRRKALYRLELFNPN